MRGRAQLPRSHRRSAWRTADRRARGPRPRHAPHAQAAATSSYGPHGHETQRSVHEKERHCRPYARRTHGLSSVSDEDLALEMLRRMDAEESLIAYGIRVPKVPDRKAS